MSYYGPPHGQQPYSGPPPQGYSPSNPQGYPPPNPQGYPPPNPQGYPPPNPQGYAPPQGYPPGPYGGPQPYQGQPGYPPQPNYQQLHPLPQQGYPPQSPAPYNQPQFSPQGHQPGLAPHPQYPPQHAYPPGPALQHSPTGFQAPPQQHVAPVDVSADIEAIYRACKGIGTDERALINVFGYRDGPTIDAIRQQYQTLRHRNLISTLESELSGSLETAMVATSLGPLESEVYFAYKAVVGIGTNEKMLTEAIMGKTNHQISAMKHLYNAKYGETLERAVSGDLSMRTKKLFLLALEPNKMDERAPVDPHAVANDVRVFNEATGGRTGKDELAVCSIFTRSSDVHLRAVALEYKRLYGANMPEVVERDFSGHMQRALLYIIQGAINKATRDATLLEESLKGGIKADSSLLMSRLIRAHWDKGHFLAVKQAYQSIYRQDLTTRVKSRTSGHFGKLMVALTS